jgi:hypothetical protein
MNAIPRRQWGYRMIAWSADRWVGGRWSIGSYEVHFSSNRCASQIVRTWKRAFHAGQAETTMTYRFEPDCDMARS